MTDKLEYINYTLAALLIFLPSVECTISIDTVGGCVDRSQNRVLFSSLPLLANASESITDRGFPSILQCGYWRHILRLTPYNLHIRMSIKGTDYLTSSFPLKPSYIYIHPPCQPTHNALLSLPLRRRKVTSSLELIRVLCSWLNPSIPIRTVLGSSGICSWPKRGACSGR